MLFLLATLASSPAHAQDEGVSPFVGVHAGPGIFLSPLKVTATPSLEVGVELPPLDRRLRLSIGGR